MNNNLPFLCLNYDFVKFSSTFHSFFTNSTTFEHKSCVSLLVDSREDNKIRLTT